MAARRVLPSAVVARSVWTIVVAGGSGRRFGAPKQFAGLGGRSVVDWATAAARPASDGLVLVVPSSATHADHAGADIVVAGGPSRSASVRCGLAAVPAEATVIVVHDAARPFATTRLFDAVIEAVERGADGAVPGVVVTDTVKQVTDDGTVVCTLPRASLRAVQTPQAFRAEVLRAAHRREAEGTDDAALVEELGGHVVVVDG